MKTAKLREVLGGDLDERRDQRRSISSHVMRRVDGKQTLVAVGGDRDAETQVNALLDALHLWIDGGRRGSIWLVLGSFEKPNVTKNVLDAVATLASSLDDKLLLSVERDVEPVDLDPPDFSDAGEGWMDGLDRVHDLVARSPLARGLSELVHDEAFQWYATVRTPLTGRVEGLTVCRLDDDSGRSGQLEIGKAGGDEERDARSVFRSVSNGRSAVEFDDGNVDEAADIVRALVKERRHGGKLAGIDCEHLLESQVLRGKVPVQLADGRNLATVLANGQFPTLWANGGRARYLDVLMRDGNEPWAVELKGEWGGGQGQYLRHAVGQVVLYREFIRGARSLHPWFVEREPPLDPTACRAAVVFPRLEGPDRDRRVADIRALADLFQVEVVEIPDWPGAGSK